MSASFTQALSGMGHWQKSCLTFLCGHLPRTSRSASMKSKSPRARPCIWHARPLQNSGLVRERQGRIRTRLNFRCAGVLNSYALQTYFRTRRLSWSDNLLISHILTLFAGQNIETIKKIRLTDHNEQCARNAEKGCALLPIGPRLILLS